MSSVQGVTIRGVTKAGYSQLLNRECLLFLAQLHRRFNPTRKSLLAARLERQQQIDAGQFPDFLPSTQHIRNDASWSGPSIPADLQDRRVELTGPVDRKMLINALNSGANCYMADFEDSTCPTWTNLVDGQINVRDAVRGEIEFTAANGKVYKLKQKKGEKRQTTLLIRPRGWHLDEAHLLVDGEVMSGSLFDFGVFFYHNATQLLQQDSAPYFYLPKMESHLEARLWNDVFVYAQQKFNIPVGSIRATVLIETILAAFEMEEILYELREHSAGLNCGRWDYIFSYIKKFKNHAAFVLPDRSQVTMTVPFMTNYVQLLIQTCHKRKVHAMGGMAAQIPIANNEAANRLALDKVRADKLREVQLGCDGTWVAHPALIPVARQIFVQYMKQSNQINKPLSTRRFTAADLLQTGIPATVGITRAGLVNNVEVGISYFESWLRGTGCVPIHHLMEDAATAEISRCQLWQWQRHQATVSDWKDNKGQTVKVTPTLLKQLIREEKQHQKQALGNKYASRFYEFACQKYEDMVCTSELDDFLTLVAYPYIVQFNDKQRAKL